MFITELDPGTLFQLKDPEPFGHPEYGGVVFLKLYPELKGQHPDGQVVAFAPDTEVLVAPIVSQESPQIGRELTAHRVNGANDQLQVTVEDEPGAGGANHRYEVTGFDTENNASAENRQGFKSSFSRQVILFQNGPIKECGVNGITQEVLLAILIDRLEGFQRGPYACHDNQMALDALQTARLFLHKRTMDRLARGVEGTHLK